MKSNEKAHAHINSHNKMYDKRFHNGEISSITQVHSNIDWLLLPMLTRIKHIPLTYFDLLFFLLIEFYRIGYHVLGLLF